MQPEVACLPLRNGSSGHVLKLVFFREEEEDWVGESEEDKWVMYWPASCE